MKFIKKAAVCIVMTSMVTTSAYAYVDNSIVFTVHESNTTHDIDMDMYGVGSEWPASGNAHLVNYAKGQGINMDFVKQIKEQGLSMEHFRQAGASSTGFLWKEALGSYDERSEMNMGINSINHLKPVFGALEQAKLADAFNPGKSTLSYTVNFIHESPSSMADLAEFFYGDGKKNYNGGVNWAQMRIAGGLPNPVTVSEWEMGNEFDGSMFSHMLINYKLYVQKCKEIIGAIKSVKEDAPIALVDPLFQDYNSSWEYAMLDELGNEAKYVVHHGYITMDSAYKRDHVWIDIAKFLDDKFGKGRLKLVVTENNAQGTLTLQEGSDAAKNGWGGCMFFGGGRGIADLLVRFLQNPSVVKTNLFATSSGTSYSIYYIDKDGKYKLNAAAMATALFQNYGIGSICESSITGFETGKMAKISGAAIKTSNNEMNLILINNTNDTDYFVNFDFEKKYKVTEKQVIEAKVNGEWAANYIGQEEIGRYTEKCTDPTIVNGYLVPKTTIMALKLKEVQ